MIRDLSFQLDCQVNNKSVYFSTRLKNKNQALNGVSWIYPKDRFLLVKNSQNITEKCSFMVPDE